MSFSTLDTLVEIGEVRGELLGPGESLQRVVIQIAPQSLHHCLLEKKQKTQQTPINNTSTVGSGLLLSRLGKLTASLTDFLSSLMSDTTFFVSSSSSPAWTFITEDLFLQPLN